MNPVELPDAFLETPVPEPLPARILAIGNLDMFPAVHVLEAEAELLRVQEALTVPHTPLLETPVIVQPTPSRPWKCELCSKKATHAVHVVLRPRFGDQQMTLDIGGRCGEHSYTDPQKYFTKQAWRNLQAALVSRKLDRASFPRTTISLLPLE